MVLEGAASSFGGLRKDERRGPTQANSLAEEEDRLNSVGDLLDREEEEGWPPKAGALMRLAV